MITHEELIAVLTEEYPGIAHGKDFWVGQPMEVDTQTGPAFIAAWNVEGVDEPAGDALDAMITNHANAIAVVRAEKEAATSATRVYTCALALKVGIVNATRTDGLTDPATPEGLAAIETRYRAFSDKMNAKRTLDQVLTDAEKNTMGLILAGFEFFEAVDAAAATILAAGDAADPIESDARWPALSA